MPETSIEAPDYGGQVIVLSILNDAALDELRRDVAIELEKRYVVANAEQQAAELNERYTRAIGRADGDEWAQPTGAHDSVPVGAVVERRGRHWRNDHGTVNPWEPGTPNAGWIEVWPDGEGGFTDVRPIVTDPDSGEEVAQPWQTGAQYRAGDKVTDGGFHWTAKIDHTSHEGWRPSEATHAVWQKGEPVA